MEVRQQADARVASQMLAGDGMADDVTHRGAEHDGGQIVGAFIDAAPTDQAC